MSDSPAWRADADAVEAAAALFLAGHPYRALHTVLPVLLSARHTSVRRFAWTLTEAFVVRLEAHPLPEPRHLESFSRIWRRYRGDAVGLGDSEAVALFDRALSASRVYDPATMPPHVTLSVFMVTPTLEASEFAYAQRLASRMLAGEEYLDDALGLVATSPVPPARAAGLQFVGVAVARLRAAPVQPSARRRELRVSLLGWRGTLAGDPEAVALLDRALAALG